jgi:succinoglycan biosynthesis transport protein ExoP
VPVRRALADLGRGTGSTPGGTARTARQLRTQQALGVASASYLPTAESARKVRPQTLRVGLFAVLLGTLFGVGLAFLWQALDTRLRSTREVSEGLGLPLLARVPANRRRFQPDSLPVMLNEPDSPEAEAFRFLRANLEAVNRARGARSIMVTSAQAGEGKSAVAANLAIALAAGGRHVTLVDLDLRNPALARSFGIRGGAGLTDVALGSARLDEALTTIPDTPGGVLRVLTSGPTPPDPAEFHTTRALASILRELRSTGDVVIIDCSPLLGIGDAVTLSDQVDALLLVTRWTVLRSPMLPELRQVLDRCRADTLGFVLTDVDLEERRSREPTPALAQI